MLKLIGIIPAATELPSVAESARRSRSGKAHPGQRRDMEYLADRYQALYHSTVPAALITPVVAHLSTLGDLLRQNPAPTERRRLHSAQMVAVGHRHRASQCAWPRPSVQRAGDEVEALERSLFGREVSSGSHGASVVGVEDSTALVEQMICGSRRHSRGSP
jgi:hypothetical protein